MCLARGSRRAVERPPGLRPFRADTIHRIVSGTPFTPIGQRGTMQIDLVPGMDLGLAIKRQVIAIFADQHMCQKTRTGTSARNRAPLSADLPYKSPARQWRAARLGRKPRNKCRLCITRQAICKANLPRGRGRTIRFTTKWPFSRKTVPRNVFASASPYSNSSLAHCPRTNGGQGLAIFAEMLMRTAAIAAGITGQPERGRALLPQFRRGDGAGRRRVDRQHRRSGRARPACLCSDCDALPRFRMPLCPSADRALGPVAHRLRRRRSRRPGR